MIFALAGVTAFSMSFMPILAERAYAGSDEIVSYEDLEGKNYEELKNQGDTEELVEDPELYHYYEVNDSGNLQEKEVEQDEVDKFIQKMDENAEGISDTSMDEMSSNMNAVGCGVSGLGKAQTPEKYGKFKRYNCLDISWWQGNISDASWQKVKTAGVTHVIIRSGYTSLSHFSLNMDSKFSNNVNRAYNAGIKVGVYHFSQATSVEEAQKEADYTIKVLKNYKSKINLPVVFDYETNAAGRLNSAKLRKLAADGTSTKICQAFCDRIEDAGYTPMIYANYTMLNNYLDYSKLQDQYRIWLANYTTRGTATTYPGEYWMWQYSSSGKVNGLSGSIDMNYIFDNGQGGSKKATGSSDTATKSEGGSAVNSEGDYALTSVTPYRAKTKSRVNYRTGPGTNYEKVGTYKGGKKVEVVGKSGDWSKLKNGYFIKSKHLKKIASYNAVTTDSVNYRTGPGSRYKKVGTFEEGENLYIVSKENGWGKLDSGYYVYLGYTKDL